MANNLKVIIVALIAILTFSSCSEDEPARMLWEVTAEPSEHVKAVFDPNFAMQIQISADGEKGEVTLKCTNYKTVVVHGPLNSQGEFEDSQCHLIAKVTEPGVIKIILEKMPETLEETLSYIPIDGYDGKNINYTNVEVVRKP